jgi:molybdate transport system substrate-binding protein
MGPLRILGDWFRRACWSGLLLLLAAGIGRAAEAPYVAAAADLKFALEEVASAFTRDTGIGLRLSFGSSGNFARQIAQGAPFELFFSADERYALGLFESGHALDGGAIYGVGRIAIYAPMNSRLPPDAELKQLAAALDAGTLRRFAIANPEHAPYGRAAAQALRHAGLWEPLQGKLALGENAAQAAQFAASGSAQAGIVPYSLALAPEMGRAGTFALIPEDWHAPLRQRVILLKGAGETARMFYDYLDRPAVAAILRRHGFGLPEGAGR